jgi:hypothetical protein
MSRKKTKKMAKKKPAPPPTEIRPGVVVFTPGQYDNPDSAFSHLAPQLRVHILKAWEENDRPDSMEFEIVEEKNGMGFPYFKIRINQCSGDEEWRERSILKIVAREL